MAKAETEFIPKRFDADYYSLRFVTVDGRTVTRTSKCGSKEWFDESYSNMEVVYDLDDPESYWQRPDFERYSLGYQIFFFFGLYGAIGTSVMYGFLNFGYVLKDKENRERIRKSLFKTKEQ